MDVSKNGVAVPDNRGVNQFFRKFLAAPFKLFCHIILLQPELTEEFSWVPYLFWSAKNSKSDDILRIVVDEKWRWWLYYSNGCC